MKKNSSNKRTVSTRSLKASTSMSKEPEASGLRRSNRGTPSKKPITPASSTRKSDRLASSPASGVEKSCGVEKKDTAAAASSLQRSDKGKNESAQSSKGSDKSGGMEKKDAVAASSSQRSDKGKNESSQSSRGSDKSGRSSDTSADTEQKKDIKKSILEESTNQIKKRQPLTTGRGYRAMIGRRFKKFAALEKKLRKKDAGTNQVLESKTDGDSAKNVAATSAQAAHEASIVQAASPLCDLSHKSRGKEVNASLNDEEPLVVGCSRQIPAANDDARDGIADCPPHANPEFKRLPVDKTSLEKKTGFSEESVRDTEKMVCDPCPMVKIGDDSVIGSPAEESEKQKLPVSKTRLETDIDLPLKRKRDTAGVVIDACRKIANGDACMMSSDGVIPSPSECKTGNLPETCRTCEKRQKINGDTGNLNVCSCIAQPVQESDLGVQHLKETGPVTSRDYGENRPNMQQDKLCDPKLSSMYPEYWVPVQLSDVQLEQYCRTLFSKSLSLSSLARNDLVGALEETLTSVRKTCDHPYLVDPSLKQLLAMNLKSPLVDVEVKASGKLDILDAMLTQIKKNKLKAVIFYQATENAKGFLLGTILEDFVMHRFGLESYEHVVCLKKKNAINNFNKESRCFVLLLERRACSQSIKLLRAEALIVFGSSLNPSQDVKLLERIKIESHSEKIKIFRLYSTCTVEEKVLILARQRKPLENLNRLLTHALLMWGASHLFDKLDQFHSSEAAESGVPSKQSIMDGVIHEFSSILSSKDGEENEGKLRLLLKVKHALGTYSSNSTLFGEEHVKESDEDSPNIFWTKLLGGKNPTWKYCSGTPQRNRKRVQYFHDSEESNQIGNGGNTKKRKKASDDVTDPPLENNEKKGSGKDNMGTLVLGLQSSNGSTCGTSNGKDASRSESRANYISGIPDKMLAGSDWRQMPHESQRSLHAVLKPEMAKLCQVLHLSNDLTSMVKEFLDYVIENYHVCEEPATSLQAFQLALSWIAATLVKQKIELKESLVRAKSELAFSCSREEVNYVYSILYCMKSQFLERTQGLKLDSAEKRGSCYSLAIKDIEKTIGDIKKKFKRKDQQLEENHKEKKVELMNKYADMTLKLEEEKRVEVAVVRFQCARTSSLAYELKQVDSDYARKFDEITSERDECLKSLEQQHEAAMKKSAENKACWISRIENWVQAELINCATIKSGNNKHFIGICSANTSKQAPDVQTCNDASGDPTCADTGYMVSAGNPAPEAENTLGTMLGGSTQQVHEMMASRNDKATGVSTLSNEQPTDNSPTKSQSSTVPEGLIPASCQEELAALKVQMSEKQSCDRVTSVAPDEDVSSRLPDISQSLANQPMSVSPKFSLIRDEPSAAKENNTRSHVDSDAENILDQQHRKTCSIDKEIPDESVFPLPHPAVVVDSLGSAAFDQDDQDICPVPSSPAGKQPDTAETIQGENIEVAIEPQPAGSETIESGGFAASDQGEQDAPPLSFSTAEIQPETAANIEGQNLETAVDPHIAGPDVVEIGDSAALVDPHIACPDTVEIGVSAASVDPHIAGPDTVKIGDSAASDQGPIGAHNTCALSSSVDRSQPDLAANIEGQNITTVVQLHVAGSGAVDTGGSAASDEGAQDESPLPFSSPLNHPDTAVDIEDPNNTTIVEHHITGSDESEMEIAEPGPQVEQSTVANNLVQLVREGSVEPSAGVTAPVPSLTNNSMEQSAVQPVPQIPFPVFSDPFQYEMEKLRRESENAKKTFEEKRSILKAELERKMAEIQAEYQRKFHEVDAEHNTKAKEIEASKNLIMLNKLLAIAFLSKCTNKNTSSPSAPPRSRIHKLAQRAAVMNVLRHVTALPSAPPSVPAPPPVPVQPVVALQPQASSLPSSVPRPSGLPLNSVLCPMPQPRQPLISNTGPSPSASPATNSAVIARLRSHAPHINAFRSSSSSPTTTVSPTSLPLPQSIAYSTVLLQPPQQEPHQQGQNLGSGSQRGNDVVCLSDDE